jgi:hypothetical protein
MRWQEERTRARPQADPPVGFFSPALAGGARLGKSGTTQDVFGPDSPTKQARQQPGMRPFVMGCSKHPSQGGDTCSQPRGITRSEGMSAHPSPRRVTLWVTLTRRAADPSASRRRVGARQRLPGIGGGSSCRRVPISLIATASDTPPASSSVSWPCRNVWKLIASNLWAAANRRHPVENDAGSHGPPIPL